MKLNKSIRVIKNTIKQRQFSNPQQYGQIGDDNQNIFVNGKTDRYVYVRIGGDTVEAYNDTVSPIYGLPVILARSTTSPNQYKIIGVNSEVLADNETNIPTTMPLHAKSHQFLEVEGSQDVVWIEEQQLLRKKIIAGFTENTLSVYIYRALIWNGSRYVLFQTQVPYDLTQALPTTTGTARYMLFSFVPSGTNGVVVGITTGVTKGFWNLDITDVPQPPANALEVIGAVRVFNGQTEILESRGRNDIADLRLIPRSNISMMNSGTIYSGVDPIIVSGTQIFSDDKRWNYIGRYGFVDNSQTTISFSTGTNVFTLNSVGATWTYMRDGVLCNVTGTHTVTIPGTPPTPAIYYIYIDDNIGTLTASTVAWTLLDDKVPVATVLYNSALTPPYWLADERHQSLIDRRMHYYEHTTEGTKHISGGLLSGYTVAPISPVNSDNQYNISTTNIADEDLLFTLAPSTGTVDKYVTFAPSTGTWSWLTSPVPYLYASGGYVKYNNAGTLTEGTINSFINTYVLFTDISGSARYVIVPGENQYGSVSEAQNENPGSFSWGGINISEFIVAYQTTWELRNSYTTLGKARLAAAPKKIEVSGVQIVDSGTTTVTGIAPIFVSGTQIGFASSGTPSTGTFLRGDYQWVTLPAGLGGGSGTTYTGNLPVYVSGTVIGLSTASTGTFLRGDGSWVVLPTDPSGATYTGTANIFVSGTTVGFISSGTQSSGTFLRGDNRWVTLPVDPQLVYTANLPVYVSGTIVGLSTASTGTFLRGDGSWVNLPVDPGKTYTGEANIYVSGTAIGFISSGTQSSGTFLRGDNRWVNLPVDPNTTYTAQAPLFLSGTTFGYISSGTPSTGTFLRGDGQWVVLPTDPAYSGQANIYVSGTNIGLISSGTQSSGTFLRGDNRWVTLPVDPQLVYTGQSNIYVSGTLVGFISSGTQSTGTFLRGDNQWVTLPVPPTYTGTANVFVSGTSIGLISSGTQSTGTFLRGDNQWTTLPSAPTYTGVGSVYVSGTTIGNTDSGSSSGTFTKVYTNSKGIVVSGTVLTASDMPNAYVPYTGATGTIDLNDEKVILGRLRVNYNDPNDSTNNFLYRQFITGTTYPINTAVVTEVYVTGSSIRNINPNMTVRNINAGSLHGIYNEEYAYDTTNINFAQGIETVLYTMMGAGTIGAYRGLVSRGYIYTGTITNYYGIIADNVLGSGTVTNLYNLYVTNPAIGQNRWAIYSAGGLNQFVGPIKNDNLSVTQLVRTDTNDTLTSAGIMTPRDFADNNYSAGGAIAGFNDVQNHPYNFSSGANIKFSTFFVPNSALDSANYPNFLLMQHYNTGTTPMYIEYSNTGSAASVASAIAAWSIKNVGTTIMQFEMRVWGVAAPVASSPYQAVQVTYTVASATTIANFSYGSGTTVAASSTGNLLAGWVCPPALRKFQIYPTATTARLLITGVNGLPELDYTGSVTGHFTQIKCVRFYVGGGAAGVARYQFVMLDTLRLD